MTGWAVAVVNDAKAGASSQGSLPGCLFATCRTPAGYLLGTGDAETSLEMDNSDALKRFPDHPPRLTVSHSRVSHPNRRVQVQFTLADFQEF